MLLQLFLTGVALGELSCELLLALFDHSVPLLCFGFPNLLHNDANHVLLQVLLVLLESAFALFEVLGPLLIFMLDASDGVVLALHGRVCLGEVSLGLVELLAKLLDGNVGRVFGGGRRRFGDCGAGRQQGNNKFPNMKLSVGSVWIATYRLLRSIHPQPEELHERACVAACQHRHCEQTCRRPGSS